MQSGSGCVILTTTKGTALGLQQQQQIHDKDSVAEVRTSRVFLRSPGQMWGLRR